MREAFSDLLSKLREYCEEFPASDSSQIRNQLEDFHFSTPRSVVLDLDGISSATLIRLFQYAEIPVSTSTTQEAFSVSFMNPGEEEYSNTGADRELTKINMT